MDPDVEAYLLGLEASLLDPAVRNSARIAELLDDDYVEFGSSGMMYSKQQVIAAIRLETPRDIVAHDFRVRTLAPGTVLVTYRASQQSGVEIDTLRSSVWQQRNGEWKLVFHQGTRIDPFNKL
jgi:hypothetical protein